MRTTSTHCPETEREIWRETDKERGRERERWRDRCGERKDFVTYGPADR